MNEKYKMKVKCDICDKFYTKNNSSAHRKTEIHVKMARINENLRNLIKHSLSDKQSDDESKNVNKKLIAELINQLL